MRIWYDFLECVLLGKKSEVILQKFYNQTIFMIILFRTLIYIATCGLFYEVKKDITPFQIFFNY